MKRISLCVAIIGLALLPGVSTVHADEAAATDAPDQQRQQKDECLLTARRCGNTAMSIQDKIERLKEEIAKGRAVYTPEELDNLRQKLNEASRTLDFLLER